MSTPSDRRVERDARPPEERQQQFFAQSQAAYDAYTDPINQVSAGTDYDSAMAAGDGCSAHALALQSNGNSVAIIVECIQQELPVFPERPQVAQGLTQAELDAQFSQAVNGALGDYQAAVDMAAQGKTAKPRASPGVRWLTCC